MKTLNVKKTTGQELNEKWGVASFKEGDIYFIRCKKNGTVNWDKAAVYTPVELVGRDKVRIILDLKQAMHQLSIIVAEEMADNV